MGVFTQIIILIAVLASMCMVLLAIRQLAKFEHFDDEKETQTLKHEVEKENKVVSHNSIFHNLVNSEEQEENARSSFRKRNNKLSKEQD